MDASFETGIALSGISQALLIQAEAYKKSRLTLFLMKQP